MASAFSSLPRLTSQRGLSGTSGLSHTFPQENRDKSIPKKVPPSTKIASRRRTAFGKRHPKDDPEALKQPNLAMSDSFQ